MCEKLRDKNGPLLKKEIKRFVSNGRVCNLQEEVFALSGKMFCSLSFVPALALDHEGRIIAANEQFNNFFSIQNELTVGSYLKDVLYDSQIRNNQGEFLCPVLESLFTGACCNMENRVVLGKNVAVFTSLILDCSGRPLGILASYYELQLNDTGASGLLRLAACMREKVGNRDTYTLSHSELVGRYAFAIASRLGLKKLEQDMVFLTGLLHDVGKILIPERIISKKGPLTRGEYVIVLKHPLYSRDILAEHKHFHDILPAVTHHHERYDGNGYPDGLRGENIPLYSRILAVVDAFEAMTADRPYRKANCIALACTELKDNAGTHFDPEIVEVFIELVSEQFSCYGRPCFPSESKIY
ncbi:MAG: Cyclic di-GMP phosphodiesterase response regulator RpfG [Pelotomaculum sp. PtaU1.Bin035]|nr:MAG: Cyclic di-GMP phosphodiesterase response regulator RpfG [Pelotomaculum sp. PtaU1.Bin035]